MMGDLLSYAFDIAQVVEAAGLVFWSWLCWRAGVVQALWRQAMRPRDKPPEPFTLEGLP
jgi:hypothetical protein